MVCYRSFIRPLAALVVALVTTLPCFGHGGGHGGGGGHSLGGAGCARGGPCGFRGGPCGFRGGYGYGRFYGYPGFYGYPWWGFGWGLGMGYGMGYGYGYPYYGYSGACPVYVNPVAYGASADAYLASRTAASTAPGGPVRLTEADVLLNIHVPTDAVVRINGAPTTQNGPRREYLSSGLAPGRTYTFVVTAQWTDEDGQAVEQEKRLHVQGGERRNVDFLTPAAPPEEAPPPRLRSGS